MSKRKRSRDTKLIDAYPSKVWRDDDGHLEKRVFVPVKDIEEMTLGDLRQKERIAKGFWARLRGWLRPTTSDADLGGTSEMGGISAAGSGGGLLGEDVFDALKEDTTRLSRYEDYRKMDEQCTELSRALFVTVSSVFTSREGDQDSYKRVSKDVQLQRLLDDLDDRVGMQDLLPGVCRTLLRVGDSFEEVVVDRALSLVRLKWLNPSQMVRNEDEFGRLETEEAFLMKSSAGSVETAIPFNAAQVIHTRHDHQRGDRYGRSFFFSARRPWRHLQPMEDSVVMNRLTRSIDFLAITVPLPEDCEEEEANRILKKTLRDIKKRRVVDESGNVDWRRAPMPDNADIVIGQPAGEHVGRANIQRLGASGVIGQLEDVKYIQRKMFMSTGVPPSYLGVEESVNAKATLCLTGDTRIPRLDGTCPTIRELVNEFGGGGEFWVYSIDENGRVVPGRATNPRLTRRDAEVWEAELDNGRVIRGTSDHPVMLRDGSYRMLGELWAGDQLMPLYRRVTGDGKIKGYGQVWQPVMERWDYIHRLVNTEIHGPALPGEVIHHVDYNKLNNDPSNLEVMLDRRHRKLHVADDRSAWLKAMKSEKHRRLKAVQMRKQWGEPESKLRKSHSTRAFSKKMSKINKQVWEESGRRKLGSGSSHQYYRHDADIGHLVEVARSYRCRSKKDLIKWSGYSELLIGRVLVDAGVTYSEFAERHLVGGYKLCRRGNKGIVFGQQRNPRKSKKVVNHKVVAVRRVGREDCYDISVDEHHNFALEAGVFVHNSWEDVQFARLLRHIQKEMSWFQRQVYDRQLVLLNRMPEKDAYKIEYPPISMVDEEIRMNVEQMKWTIYGLARAQGIPTTWLLRKIVGLDDDEIGELESLGIEEPAPGGPAPATGAPPFGAEEHAREKLFGDMRIANDVRTFRDMIRVVRAERLNKPAEF